MWLDHAQQLAFGIRTRVKCCSGDNSGVVSHGEHGYSFRCFRCGRSEFEPHGQRSVQAILQARATLSALASPEGKVPRDMVPLDDASVPSEARLWGLRCGLSPEVLSDRWGFRYAPTVHRVFLPTGEGAGFLRKVVPSDADPRKYAFIGNQEYTAFEAHHEESTVTVVTEDALSAIKVHNAGYRAVALMSTACNRTTASLIAKTRRVVVWLDPDRAGQAARAGVRRALGIYDVHVQYVITDSTVDPKYLDKGRIAKDLEDTLNGR